jgi:O-antigen/teichoic acid export membrane protein
MFFLRILPKDTDMSLKNKVISGLKWSIITKLIAQLFSWISTFFVIRMLSPEDYGIMALAMAFVLFGNLFSSGGFITAIVKTQSKNYLQASQMFTVSLVVNIIIAFLVIFSSEYISVFYSNPKLEAVLFVMAIASILNSFLIIPSSYLDIDMNFKAKALCDSVGSIVSAIVALVIAYHGLEFWALVYSFIAQMLVRVTLYHGVAKSRYFITLDFKGATSVLKFAYTNQLNSILWFGYNQIDNILIGKFLGINLLGIYNVAKDIASLPMMKVTVILNQVGFSAFASLNEDESAARYYLERSLTLIAIFAFPVFLGISSISEEIILLVIGDKWLEAAPIISVLCFVFPFRMMSANIQIYVNALNKPKFNVQNTLIMSITLITLMIWATQISLFVTALTWVMGFVLVFLIVLLRLKYNLALTKSTTLVWVRSAFISFIMWIVLYIEGRYLLNLNLNLFLMIIIKVISGIIIIVPVYYKFYGTELKSILKNTG